MIDDYRILWCQMNGTLGDSIALLWSEVHTVFVIEIYTHSFVHDVLMSPSSLELNIVFYCMIMRTLCGVLLTHPGKSQTSPAIPTGDGVRAITT